MNICSYCLKLKSSIENVFFFIILSTYLLHDFFDLQNISPGMKLWGVIAEVNDKDLAVSLPGGLRGLVRANEAVESALLDDAKVIFLRILQYNFVVRLISHMHADL